MLFSLNREQLHKLLDANWDEVLLHQEDTNLRNLLSECKAWSFELVCFNYFIAQILDQKLKHGEEIQNLSLILARVLAVHEEINLTFEEFDERFIGCLFENIRDKKINLEENLIEIRNRLDAYG